MVLAVVVVVVVVVVVLKGGRVGKLEAELGLKEGELAGADVGAAGKPDSPKEQSPSLQTVPAGHWEHGWPVVSMERPMKLPAGP